MTTNFADGYQAALEDVLTALDVDGIDAALVWIENNTQRRGSKERARRVRFNVQRGWVPSWPNEATPGAKATEQCGNPRSKSGKLRCTLTKTHDFPVHSTHDKWGGREYLWGNCPACGGYSQNLQMNDENSAWCKECKRRALGGQP